MSYKIIKGHSVKVSNKTKLIKTDVDNKTITDGKMKKASDKDSYDFEEQEDIEEISQGESKKLLEEKIQVAEAEAQEIVAQAKIRAEQILEDASRDIEEERKMLYAQTIKEAEEEIESRLGDLEEKLKVEYAQKYEDDMRLLEPKVAQIIEELVKKIVGKMSYSKSTIIHLVRMGLSEIRLQGDMIIRLSEADLDTVLMKKDELTSDLSEKLTIEFLKDKSLKQNQCIIETNMGNIDCSLGTALENLRAELQLIKESLV